MSLTVVDVLEVGPAPVTVGAVWIPVADLRERTHELPVKGSIVRIVPSDSAAAAEALLAELGWCTEILRSSPRATPRPILWSPSPLVAEYASASNPSSWLDLGCGCGRDAVFVAAHGHSVLGVDHLPDAIDLATRLSAQYNDADERSRIGFEVGPASLAVERHSRDAHFVSLVWFFDRTVLRLLAENLQPGACVLVDTYSKEHYATFGRPNPDRCVDISESFEPFTVLRLSGSSRHGKQTAQVVLQR